MDAVQAGEGKLAFTLRRADRRSSARSPRSTSRSTSSRTRSRPHSPPAAPSCSSPRARRRSRRCCSPSSRTRRACRRAGSTSSRARQPRSATCWSRTSASRRSRSPARPRSAGASASARRGRRSLLELGNATPVIVDADADVDEAATKLAAQRLLVRRPELHLGPADLRAAAAYDHFVERFLPQGRGATWSAIRPTPRHDVGPVIDEGARERILAGSTRPALGRRGARGWRARRRLISPTVIAERRRGRRCACDEVFGPVVTVSTYDSSTRRSSSPTARATASRPESSPPTSAGRADGRPAARVRRRDYQRGADVPRRPDAVRGRQGFREHTRGTGVFGA